MRIPVLAAAFQLRMALLCALTLLIATGTVAAGTLDFSMENAYRRDSLDWSIDGYNPAMEYVNIRSELIWKDIEIYQLSAEGVYRFARQSDAKVTGCIKGRAGYGWIFSGKNQDSDYDGSNRTDEFSRSNNNSDEGHTIDLLAGGGVRLAWLQGHLSLTPLAGLSYHQQKLTLSDGYQTIPAFGGFPGLASSYTAEWYGPWLGADLEWRPVSRVTLATTLELHAVRYYGEGNWNLRSDLQHPQSFDQEGDGSGAVLALKGGYRFDERFALSVQGRMERWRVEDGEQKFYLSDGTIAQSSLNEVNHTAASVGVQLNLSF